MQLLVPVSRPGQVRMTARLLYRTDQVTQSKYLIPCVVLLHLFISRLCLLSCLQANAAVVRGLRMHLLLSTNRLPVKLLLVTDSLPMNLLLTTDD